MSEIWQMIVAAIGASGIVGVILTLIVTRLINRQFAKQDQREKLRDNNMFLMMERVDNCAEMTHLMAKKLHDAGIINGDLEELDNRNKELNGKYEDHLRNLALEVLNK